MHILFEGIDGVGKSTQIEIISKILPNCVKTHEPGATHFGKKIREILLNGDYNLSKNAEMFLFLADRAEHSQKFLSQNQDKIILCDRGFISGIAYAMSNDKNIDVNFLLQLNHFVLGKNLPNAIVLFRADEYTIKNRLNTRNMTDRIEKRGIEYLIDVQENMLKLVSTLSIPHIIIQAQKDIKTITDEILEFIKELK
ncbi:Thymidylate kinase [Campylobacter majalis]|uniref:Thymidylate kinase n=1 Tax=Campylobacter majalis TaxID=2790656 RepID=A0ABN7K8V8_9BACT|nr:dTMP kinase [Campylobacter majalis]CAD7287723.1 Thymidylate kinase [Campylobacter majalis]